MISHRIVVAIATALLGCAVLAHPASATPSCQQHPCPNPAAPQAHMMVEGDTGQGMSTNVPPARLQADLSISKDAGPQNMDVGVFACQGGMGYEATTHPINWAAVYAGTDCISAKYNNIGIINQHSVDQHGVDDSPTSYCGGAKSEPYDSFYAYLKTQTGALTVSNGSLPAIYNIQGTAGTTFANHEWQVQGAACNGSSPSSQDGLSNPGFVINLASPFTKYWEDRYNQGIFGLEGDSSGTFPWQGYCVNGVLLPDGTHNSNGCFDNYALILADRQVPNRDCIGTASGVNGGFREADNQLATGTFFDDLPGLDADRSSFYAQSFHRASSWNPNGLFYYQLNSGDCEASNDPSFPVFTTTTGSQSFFATVPPNVIGFNAENTLADPNSCNNWTSFNQGAGTYAGQEPKRYNSRAVYTVNSAFTSFALKRAYVEETSCAQTSVSGNITATPNSMPSPCNVSQTYTNAAGVLDLSLRYWMLSINLLTYDPKYMVSRDIYYGVGTNVGCGVPAFAEQEEIVVADPDVTPGAYVRGSGTPTGDCNSGSGSHGALAAGTGESGGILPLMVSNTCGPTNTGGSFFTRAGVASRQFHDCWINGQYVGSCGVIVNFRNSVSNGAGTGAQNYVANMCGTSNGTAGSTDGDPFARDGGCYDGSVGYHHTLSITNPLDQEEGGAIALTTGQESIAQSNASDNTAARCHQGPDWSEQTNGSGSASTGTVTVCEAMGMLVYP